MALETELKFLDPDFSAVRARLRQAGAEFRDRCFESNAVYDDSRRSLKEQSILLRLRMDREAILTVKHPPFQADTPCPDDVKVLEEIQTVVADHGATDRILRALGYEAAFMYEKIRETWEFNGCEICMDTLPFGDFLEIEGEREALMEAAHILRLDFERTSTSNYRTLHIEHRKENNLPFEESFVFTEEERARIKTEMESQHHGI